MKKVNTYTLAMMSMFSAIIVLLAFVPYIGYIRLPFLAIQATTIHIPVIVGSILLGPKCGAVLGGVFGLTSLINNTIQPGIISFCFSPFIDLGEGLGGSPLALVVCFIPRILCGVVPFYVYKGFRKIGGVSGLKDKVWLLISGIAGSLTNTVLVMGMIYLFFGQQYAIAKEIAYEAVIGVVLSVVGINGTLEAITAAIIASAATVSIQKAGLIRKR